MNAIKRDETDEPHSNSQKLPNQFKSLVISNISEVYHSTYKKAGAEEAAKRSQYDFLEAERAVFYTGDKKVVITSMPIDASYIEDIKQILGYATFQNLYPAKPSHRLSFDILKDKVLLTKVEEIIRQNPSINIIPYYATEEFFDLLTVFKQRNLKFVTPETVSMKNRFIRDHYNCKVGFRKLWEKTQDEHSFVKIPQGFIVDDLTEAIEAAWWFYQHKIDFVMKYNRGTSGLGIAFYRCQDLPHEEKKFKKYLRSRHTDRIWFEEVFVVEEFIDIDEQFYGGSPSIEFNVNDDVNHSYNCLQRLGENAYFEGILISKEAEEQSEVDFERVKENCIEFGQALADLGYRGIFDIDLVIDKKHNIYAVESNLRRTGGTHIFETARYLFGRNFQRKIVVSSRDNLPVANNIKTYSDFKKLTNHLYFSKEKGEGIIPAITSFLSIGKIGYLAFAKTQERLKQIEKALLLRIVL